MSCVNKVRATLEGLVGVEKVEVDFKAKTATITMKSGTLDKAGVEKALTAKGYGLSDFKETKVIKPSATDRVTGLNIDD